MSRLRPSRECCMVKIRTSVKRDLLWGQKRPSKAQKRLTITWDTCIVMIRLLSESSRYSTKPNPRDLQQPHHRACAQINIPKPSTQKLYYLAPACAGFPRTALPLPAIDTAGAQDPTWILVVLLRAPPRRWRAVDRGATRANMVQAAGMSPGCQWPSVRKLGWENGRVTCRPART
jgi:hypothetical protein